MTKSRHFPPSNNNKQTCVRLYTHEHSNTLTSTQKETDTHTPSSWELSSHCLLGPWSEERESYLSFCSARGSRLNTASVVPFSQHDAGEREEAEGERETEADYKRGFN